MTERGDNGVKFRTSDLTYPHDFDFDNLQEKLDRMLNEVNEL